MYFLLGNILNFAFTYPSTYKEASICMNIFAAQLGFLIRAAPLRMRSGADQRPLTSEDTIMNWTLQNSFSVFVIFFVVVGQMDNADFFTLWVVATLANIYI